MGALCANSPLIRAGYRFADALNIPIIVRKSKTLKLFNKIKRIKDTLKLILLKA